MSADQVTGRLAAWISGLTAGDVPAATRERASHLLLDAVGAGLVGAQLPWSRIATDAVLGLEGAGSCSVIGTGLTTSAPGAVLLNSTFVQGFELDDFHPVAPVHSGSLVLPVLLAVAGQRPVNGADALTAAIAGFEVGPRIGLALHGAQMLSRGWHSGAVFGPHAAAAVAGRLLGLDPGSMEDALGTAATQAGGLMAAQFGSMSKRMQHGFAARNGFYAAGLAAAGYTGIKAVYDEPYGGFLAVFGEGHDPDPGQLVAGLGESWHTDVIMIKSFAAQGGLHGTIEAVLALRAAHDIDPRAVRRIDIRVGRAVHRHGWWRPRGPLTATGAQMHLGYAATVALLDGEVGPAQFTERRLDADDVSSLLARCEAHVDEEIEARPLTERFATVVEITLADGTVLEYEVVQPHGGPADPVSNDEVVAKFRTLTHDVIDPDRQSEIELAVLGLDELDDLGRLSELLAAPAAAVI